MSSTSISIGIKVQGQTVVNFFLYGKTPNDQIDTTRSCFLSKPSILHLSIPEKVMTIVAYVSVPGGKDRVVEIWKKVYCCNNPRFEVSKTGSVICRPSWCRS